MYVGKRVFGERIDRLWWLKERLRDQNLEMAASYHKNCPAIHGAARNWPIREASIRAVKRVISG